MLNFIKKNLFIVTIFFITLLLGFVTFLTFLDKSFIKLNDENLQYLLTNISLVKEVSIGHALVCDTFVYGLENTIKKYLSIINNSQK